MGTAPRMRETYPEARRDVANRSGGNVAHHLPHNPKRVKVGRMCLGRRLRWVHLGASPLSGFGVKPDVSQRGNCACNAARRRSGRITIAVRTSNARHSA